MMMQSFHGSPRFADSKVRVHVAVRALSLLVVLSLAVSGGALPSRSQGPATGLLPIRDYIRSGWDRLTRSLDDCATFADPKLTGPPTLYLPADFSAPDDVEKLPAKCGVAIAVLPVLGRFPGEVIREAIKPPGLLYLPKKYVVPGGRFNEMYGWDSYFIIRGLIEDGRIELARGMVENFAFELMHYNSILNANRTYYLTRSQPPFLTSMILAVYEAERAAGREDRGWLGKMYAVVGQDYLIWGLPGHQAGETKLAAYHDFGEGPAPESVEGEPEYYAKVARFFLAHPEMDRGYVVRSDAAARSPAVGPAYDVPRCGAHAIAPDCDPAGQVHLSADYYQADRAMRESGFDISFRFGPYGAESNHFAPVCLNSLLYEEEMDSARIVKILGIYEPGFDRAAQRRRKRMQKYFWDQKRGEFFDYDFATKERSSYDYLTTFYPLWVGLATPEQARAVDANLKLFEQAGGLAMSRNDSGVQWDYPYEWAPTVLIAVEGLRRYGFNDDANRIAYKFLSTVAENFRRDGTIREKYNAVTRSSETAVAAGYKQNVVGFGWTNGAFLCLLKSLPSEMVDRLAAEQRENGVSK